MKKNLPAIGLLTFALFICFTAAKAQFTPVHKLVIEDQTVSSLSFGQFCPRGIVYMDSIGKGANASRVEIISIHSDISHGVGEIEPMTDSAYWTNCFTNPHVSISAWPTQMLDRKLVSNTDSALFHQVDSLLADTALADINVSLVYDTVGRTLKVKADVHVAVDVKYPTPRYALAMVLTEDSVHGTDPTYAQRNNYTAGGWGPMHSSGGLDFVTQPDPVPASLMYYRHVSRGIYGGFTGTLNSLPDTMLQNSTHEYTFPDITIPANYNVQKMRAIVLMINRATGAINNANGADLKDAVTGVLPIADAMPSFSIFPNPFSSEASLKYTLSKPGNVTMRITDLMGKTISSVDLGAKPAGQNTYTVNGKELTPGIYFVTLQAGQNAVTKKIVLSR